MKLNNRNLIVISLILLTLVFAAYYTFNNAKTTIENDNKYPRITEALLGKKISSIKKIVDADISQQQMNIVVGLYNGNDCQTCVKNCYNIIRELDSLKYETYLITSMSSIANDQIRYDYVKKIYLL